MENNNKSDEYIVEFKSVTKRFPGIIANESIDLGIKKGEIFALLGENGAGKSTLMSMLFGMYEPSEGQIYVRGKKSSIKSPNEAADLSIGMVHQHFKLVENFTVTENIVLGKEPIKSKLGLKYVDIKGTDEKIRDLSVQYGLKVNPKDVIEDIDVSTRQRVEILKMLYREAEILIFDEPTAMLTPQEIEFLLEIIENLRESGKTIILITHKLDEVKKVADRCAVLRRGKLVGELDVKTASTGEMANMMVGKDIVMAVKKDEMKKGKPILELENLTVANSEGFEVVKNVSFKVHEGEIFSLAGVSGNGQREIADAIAGLAHVKLGKILLSGKDIRGKKVREITEAGISYIPEDRQNVGLILDKDLAENLALKSYYRKPFSKKGVLQKEEFDAHAKELIQEFDIRSGRGEDTIVRSMSGGNQQKAIVAREIDLDSQLMIFFQPTRGLDVGAINNIHARMIEERDKGKAILLISLELEEVIACADTIGVIYNGEIQRIEDAHKISRHEIGEAMMGVGTNEEKK